MSVFMWVKVCNFLFIYFLDTVLLWNFPTFPLYCPFSSIFFNNSINELCWFLYLEHLQSVFNVYFFHFVWFCLLTYPLIFFFFFRGKPKSFFFLIIRTFNYYLFIYLFILAVLGLRFCARAFSSCTKRGPLFIVVRGPLTIAASLVVEHRLQMRRLSSCGTWAQLLRGMWDLPRPGLEPMSLALAGRFSTTAPPGKAYPLIFYWCWIYVVYNKKLQRLQMIF